MTPYGIVYRDTVASLNEGADIWQKKSGIVNKKYVALSLVLISALIIGVNRIVFTFYSDPEQYYMGSIILTVIEIISVIFLLITTLRKNARNIFIRTNSSNNVKQAVLREEDIEFSTSFSKSNYFYDEIDSVIEGIYSLNIVIEKGNLPICISKIDIAKGDIEKFIFLLKDKMKERYFTENKIGGKRI